MRAAAVAAGLLTLWRGRSAEAQQGRMGRAGQPSALTPPRQSRYTTYALGEEGGGRVSPRQGDDYGYGRSPIGHRDPVTTFALGEEGGGATTFALGEEGGGHGYGRPLPPRRYDQGRATTFALGEEGGRSTTFALGEEGGWY